MDRLIKMNQWGEFIYIGKYKYGKYKGYGDYSDQLNSNAVEEIMRKLYFFEENFDSLSEDLNINYD